MLTLGPFTDMPVEVKRFCEGWLMNWKRLNKHLAQNDTLQSTSTLAALIAYEANTRQRYVVMDRLLGRWAKLLRNEETDRLKLFIKVATPHTPVKLYERIMPNAGECN